LPKVIRGQRLIEDARWLIRIRWMAAGVFVLGMLAFWVAYGPLILAILYLALVICAYNGVCKIVYKRIEHGQSIRTEAKGVERFIQIQFVLDTLLLSAVIIFSGGPLSPLVIFYLPQVALTGTILTRRAAMYHVLLILAVFSLMIAVEYAMPGWRKSIVSDSIFVLPVTGKVLIAEIVGLSLVLFMTAYIVGMLADKTYKREIALAEALASLGRRTSELANASRKFSELQERKTNFLDHAAHQLLSPLAAVESCLGVSLGGYSKDPVKDRDLVIRAHNRVRRMIDVVKDLLALARARVAAPEKMDSLVEFDTVVCRVVALRESVAREKEIDLQFRPGMKGCKIRGVERGLEDVASNLISNAIKYTRANGIVKVRTFSEGGRLVFEVLDTGIGMSWEDTEKVFGDFFRAPNAREVSSDGTGLGLPIVKEILDKHGGSVVIKSLLNLGTCVTVFLPIAEDDRKRISKSV